jgi:hypothetical protein
MESWFRPLVGVVLVAFLPGVLTVRILRPGRPSLEELAVAPALTCGLLFLFFEALRLVSLPVAPPTFAALLAALAVLALRAQHRGADDGVGQPDPPRVTDRVERVLGLGLCGLAVVVGSMIWLRALPAELTVPPNHDSMHHGYMAARIAETGSIDSDEVIVTSPRFPGAVVPFYPIGLHIVAALAHRITGGGFSDIFWWFAVIGGGFCFPLGMFCLARRLFRGDVLVAGAAALLSVLVPLFPYKPIAWGGIALIVGLSLVPGVAVLLLDSVRHRWSAGSAVLGALGLIGLLIAHTSEVPTALLVLAVVVLDGLRWRDLRSEVRVLAPRLAAIGLLFALVAAPIMARVTEERAVADNPTAPFWSTLDALVRLDVATPVGQERLALMAVVGAAVLLGRRRPWVVLGLLGFAVLYEIVSVSTNSSLRSLAAPWYRQAERVAYNMVPFVALLGAVGLVALARAVTTPLGPGRVRGWAAGGLALLGALVVGSGVPGRTTQMLRNEINAYSAVGPNESAAFRFLSAHGGRRLAVLGDELGDGSIWMYAFSGASPVFGIKPSTTSPWYGTWKERQFLLKNLTNSRYSAQVDSLMAKYCVGFVFYSERRLFGAEKTLDLASLQHDGRLKERFRSEGTIVFKVEEPRCDQLSNPHSAHASKG